MLLKPEILKCFTMQLNNTNTKTNPKYIQPLENNNSTNDIPKRKKKTCCSFPFILVNIFIVILVIIFTMLAIYFFYFKKESFDQILASNLALSQGENSPKYDGVTDGSEGENVVLDASQKWEQYIKDMGLVALGTIYDSCNESNRVVVGKTVLVNANNRIATKTFFNATFVSELTGGKMYMKTVLNGFHLRTKDWNVCKGQGKEDPNQMTVDCPVKQGYHSFEHVKIIPAWALKGTYTVTSWVTDQDGNKMLCGYTKLTL